jgi:DNA-binding IclR family transcriptional regulator
MSQPESGTDGRRTVGAVEKTCRILDALHYLEGAGITELADELDVSKGTVHTHLATLRENNYVVKEGTIYRPSLRFLELGEGRKTRNRLYQAASEEIEELAVETDTRVQVVVEEFGLTIPLTIARSPRATLPPTSIGMREYPHCIASGKAILAHFPHERVEEIIDEHGLPARTPHTITEADDLFEELERIREAGVAFNNEEKIEGLRAVGAAVRSDTGRVLGSISASGPTSDMAGDRFREEIPAAVSSLTNTVELNIRVAEDRLSPVKY